MQYIGDYMSDDVFINALNICRGLINEYLEEHKTLIRIEQDIMQFVRRNIKRIPVNESVKFILCYPETDIDNERRNIVNLFNADFSAIDDLCFEKILNFIRATKGAWNNDIEYFSIVVRSTLKEQYKEKFDEEIKSAAPNFYDTMYLLNAKRNPELFIAEINNSVNRINEFIKNKTGSEIFFDSKSMRFNELCQLIKQSSTKLDESKILEISTILEKIIWTKSYELNIKIASLDILLFLLGDQGNDTLKDLALKIINEIHTLPKALSFQFSNIPLSPFINYLALICGHVSALEYAFATADNVELPISLKIELLKYICSTSFINFSKQPEDVISLIVGLMVEGLASTNHSIRQYSIRILINIACSQPKINDKIIKLLFRMYEIESPPNKTFIVKGLWDIDNKNSSTEEILKISSNDNNYRVSRLAKELTAKLDSN